MTLVIPPWLANLVTVLVCGSALWKGGRDERLVSATLLLNIAISLFLLDASWPHVQIGMFAVDVLSLAVFVGVALRSESFWPLCVSAFQLLGVMTHVAKMVDPALEQWAYITAGIIWTYLLMAALAVGTWNAWRRRAAQRQETATPAVARR